MGQLKYVYAMIGSPQVFRLRYGWFSDAEVERLPWQAPVSSSHLPSVHNVNFESRKRCVVEEAQVSVPANSDLSKKLDDTYKTRPILQKENSALEHPFTIFSNMMGKYLTTGLKANHGDVPRFSYDTSLVVCKQIAGPNLEESTPIPRSHLIQRSQLKFNL
ncbi:hypothetical protein F3Y22_tig00002840pilonHSYRG00099 [Hibiscus syriacus]|uniref:Uncharacterized protein n=1 Tax=Hibiscus syriacus TaxID=106335 RepID=A0A6A3CQZ9_HIBSY|nr:hypothetical protein F3Y22_tig00002840pilonHSYRG00099 [Hibiscus syriacus]